MEGAWTDSVSFWIACIAFLQPYLIWLYVRLFKTWTLKSFDFERLEIGFSLMGPYLAYMGAFVSRNADSFLHRAVCSVARDGGQSLRMRLLFRREQSLKNSGAEIEGKLALGIFLVKDTPQNVDLFFSGDRPLELQEAEVTALRLAWQALCAELVASGIQPNELPLPAVSPLANEPAYRDLRERLRQQLFWQVGRHELKLELFFDLKERAHSKLLHFEVKPEDLARIEANLDLLLSHLLTGLALQPSNALVPLLDGGTVTRHR